MILSIHTPHFPYGLCYLCAYSCKVKTFFKRVSSQLWALQMLRWLNGRCIFESNVISSSAQDSLLFKCLGEKKWEKAVASNSATTLVRFEVLDAREAISAPVCSVIDLGKAVFSCVASGCTQWLSTRVKTQALVIKKQ